jgi:hypothetical protein
MAEFVAQMRDRKAAYILQLDSLQSCPEILAGIHFRGIGGEAFHMGPVRRFINPIPIAHRLDRHRLIWLAAGQKLLEGTAFTCPQSIVPDRLFFIKYTL